MRLPDGSILMHGTVPYDPTKAHDYYIRTRKLKGRTKGSGQQKHPTSGSFTVRTKSGLTVKLNAQELNAQRTYAAARVKRISAKLHTLEAELRKRMAEARKKERAAAKPDTAAEKHKKAQESAKFRDKHKQELKNKSKKASAVAAKKKPDTNSVEGLKRTIDTAKRNLRAAVERQRALMTATKN